MSDWEPVVLSNTSNDGWEPVPTSNDGWEPVPMAASEEENPLMRAGRAAVGGLEFAGSMLSKVPQAVWSGYSGLGAAMTGGDIGAAMERAHQQVPGYEPQTEFGQLAGQAMDDLRTKAGELAGDNPLLQTANEVATDVIGMVLPMGPRVRGRVTPQEAAYVDGLRSIEQRRVADQNKPEPAKGTQFELPLEESPYSAPKPAFERPTLMDMMDRVDERVVETNQRLIDEQLAKAGPQADMFNDGLTTAGREVPFRETFPGTRRTEQLRIDETKLPYEDARLAPELEQARIEQMQDNTRTTDLRGQRPTIDFPLRQEAIDADPYVRTLKEEADRAFAEYNRLQKWMDHYQKSPKSVIEKMDQAAAHIEEVTKLAEDYLKETYNVTPVDKFTGSLFGDKPTALPIEKTERPFLGNPRQLSLNKTKGGRQRGTVDFSIFEPSFKKLREWVAKVYGKRSDILKGQDGIPVIVFRGQHSGAHDPRTPRITDNGRYAVFTTDNAYLAGDYAVPIGRDSIIPDPNSPGNKAGAHIVPFVLRPTKIIEFPKDRTGSFNMFEFDRKARMLGKGEVLVVRDSYDHGPNSGYDHPRNRDTYKNDQYAFTDPDIAVPIFEGAREMDPFKGPGRKQVGGLNPEAFRGRKDPEFERFKADLPAPLRKDAKRLYKQWKRSQTPVNPPEVFEGENVTKAIKDIPGVKNWKDLIAPIEKSPEEIIAQAVSEPDLPDRSLGQQLVAGGKLYGFGTQNTVARYTVQQMDRALREATRQVAEHILDDSTGFKPKWEKLSKEDFAELWSVLRAHEGKLDLNRDALFELGLSEKQVEAGLALRTSLDAIFDRFNQVRTSLGKKPIEKRLGYIPSRFMGDWIVEARDVQGNLVHRMGASTKFGAGRIKALMEEKMPDLTYSDVKHEPLHRFKDASDATAGYQAILEVLASDDPRVQALESAYGDFLQQQAYEALNFRRHFKQKTGVRGAEGDKVWLDAQKNAEEGLRSVMNYMDHGLKWAEAQEALAPVRTVLKDENVAATQPNAVKWAQGYIDQALGRSTKLARHIDAIADVAFEKTGIGQSLFINGAREFKHFMTTWALGFYNVGFSLSQLVQVAQTIPAWQHMFVKKGVGAGTMFNSYALGSMDAVKVFGGLDHTMSKMSRDAMKFAKDYGIIKPHILDDAKNEFSRSMSKTREVVMEWSMTKPELAARTMAYMTWVHFLHESGQFKPGRQLYETAANLTDMTMVDYRGHERAMLYKNMGIAGEMANAITSYKHNYFSQMWALKKQGGLSPVASMVAIGMMLSGLMGLPGREDVDAIIRLLNFVSPERIPTTRELFMKTPDLVGFGGLSAATGLDLSGKFSTANILPDNVVAFIQPFLAMGLDLGAALVAALKNPSEPQLMRSLQQLAPGGAKALPESYFTRENARGQDIYIDPKTMEGRSRRGPLEKTARGMGLRSMEESFQMNEARNLKDAESFNARKRSALINKAQDVLFATKDPKEIQEKIVPLAIEYVRKREGSAKSFVSALEGSLTAQQMTTLENMVMDAVRNPQKGKRVYDKVKERVFKQ